MKELIDDMNSGNKKIKRLVYNIGNFIATKLAY